MLSGDYYHVVETITNPGGRKGSILPESTEVTQGIPPLVQHTCSHKQKFMLMLKYTQLKLSPLGTNLKQAHLQGSV